MEARMLMLAPNNIFSPSSGKPITTPSQDITLGCYYLTQNPRGVKKEAQDLPLFADPIEVEFAIDDGAMKTHDRIRLRNPDFGKQTIYGNRGSQGYRDHRRPRCFQPDLAKGPRFLQPAPRARNS